MVESDIRAETIIDNKTTHNMKDVLTTIAKQSSGFKCATGYLYMSGLLKIIHSLKDHKNIEILMGNETDKLTKNELINAFQENFGNYVGSISELELFYKLIKNGNLKIKIYFGNKKTEKLHSKMYLFIRNPESNNKFDRYAYGVIGSSNFTHSGLVGNTELNTVIGDRDSLKDIEDWFINLWNIGSENFEDLRVSDSIINIIEKSNSKLKDKFEFVEPREFFKMLINFLNADYLFPRTKESKLLQFQKIDVRRILDNFHGYDYKGCFLTSSVGLGKSYVAAEVAEYFINAGKKVLIIAPAGLVKSRDQWPRYLKEFGIFNKIELESMGNLQKPHGSWLKKYTKNYGLIIVDEAHSYRRDSNRTQNLKQLIDNNGNSKILLLTATPINTSPEDLIRLVNLFHRTGNNNKFDEMIRDLSNMINLLQNQGYNGLNNNDKKKLFEVQEDIESEMFVKSTRGTIKTSLEYIEELKLAFGVDITKLKDPYVREIKYQLDSRYKDMVNYIVEFITSLSAAHLRLLDPERGEHLGGFFKWILYKRFESDISSYYLTLKRLHKKNTLILNAIEKKDIKYLDDEEYEDDITINMNMVFKEKLLEIIKQIKSGAGQEYYDVIIDLKKDLVNIDNEIHKMKPFLKENSKILFNNDQKINQLASILQTNKKFLVFTEYRDTLLAIKEYMKNIFKDDKIQFIDSNTENKQRIIDMFNDQNNTLRIIITTDTLAEGYNIGGTDIVINFDIPYNPVKIIQRIGRATRLDVPKEIEIINFRPDDDIDVEINLVETMQFRIEDIIRFIGIDYRIWFETEKKLVAKRRIRDTEIYLKIRDNMRSGSIDKLEIKSKDTRPVSTFLYKIIKFYNIKKNEIESSNILPGKYYTLFEGKQTLSILGKNLSEFNSCVLTNRRIKETNKKIDFETIFNSELKNFDKFQDLQKHEEIGMEYYSFKTQRDAYTIIDYIDSKKLDEHHLEFLNLKNILKNVHNKCGGNTNKIIQKIKSNIKNHPSKHQIIQWADRLEESFSKQVVQEKLNTHKESLFAVGFLDKLS